MQDQITFDAVAAIVRRVCQHPLPELAPDTYLDKLPNMDSLRVLHVVAMMEEQFGVEIDVTALDSMRQVMDVLNAVRAGKRVPDGAGTPGCSSPVSELQVRSHSLKRLFTSMKLSAHQVILVTAVLGSSSLGCCAMVSGRRDVGLKAALAWRDARFSQARSWHSVPELCADAAHDGVLRWPKPGK